MNNESSEIIRIFNTAFNDLLPADKAKAGLVPSESPIWDQRMGVSKTCNSTYCRNPDGHFLTRAITQMACTRAGSSYHPNLHMRKRSTRSSKLWIRWLLSLPGKDYVVGGSTQTLYVTAVRNFHAKTRLFTNCRYQTIVNVMLQHWCPSAVCRYFSVLTVTVKIPYVNVDLPAQIALYKGWREISGKGHGNLPW